ncbi:hypothetical protein SSTU70S_00371 [Stutzerimonas stutzeri]
MSSPREAIKTIRDFEQFLKSRGFSGREAKILARAYRDLDGKAQGGFQGPVAA